LLVPLVEFISSMSSLRKQSGMFDLMFGDASDGDLSVGPATTITLDRDMYYDVVTLSGSGAEINTNSFRFHAHKVRFLTDDTSINNDGPDGATPAGGVSPPVKTLNSGGLGGDGNVIVGSPGGTVPGSYGGSGGIGGSGSNAGGIGGQGGNYNVESGSVPNIFTMLLGYTFGSEGMNPIGGGAGGGGGGGPGAIQAGGGGGAGGGVMVASIGEIEVATGVTQAFIRCRGGDGGDGQGGGITGGGGGGGGGVVLLLNTFRPPKSASVDFSGEIQIIAPPGIGGSPSGGGVAGTDGVSGSVFILDV
jgi:hypothetical protein